MYEHCDGVLSVCTSTVMVFWVFIRELWWCSECLYEHCDGVLSVCTSTVMVFWVFVRALWWCSECLYEHCDGVLRVSLRTGMVFWVFVWALWCSLATIDGDDGYTGVKPQHRYVTCSPWHRPPPLFRFFFYSNKNNFVQLEDTKIKTECWCSMQRNAPNRQQSCITAV